MARRSWLVWGELVFLIAAVPLLLFPRGNLPWVGLGLLTVGWLSRGYRTGVWLAQTALNRPVAVLLLMTLVSLYPSLDLALSMPKFYGILLGFAIYYAACGAASSGRRFWLGVGLLIGGLIAVICLGLIGSDWSQYKFPFLRPVYNVIPKIIGDVQTSFGSRTGFHPNELGGTLAFLFPLSLALGLSVRLFRPLAIGLVAAAVVGLGVLVLTASRSAITAAGLIAVLLVAWRWRRFGLVLTAGAVVAVGVTLILSAPTVLDFLLKADAVSVGPGEGSLPGRLEIWERARYMIEDFPFTGIGLNTFPIVLETLYPLSLAGPPEGLPHAHNIFLQTAVDLGLGGLLGFLALWASVAYTGWRAYRRVKDMGDRGPFQAAIVGMLLGLLSYLVFGLTDAITLGAKPTVLLWLMMGLIVAAERLAGQAEGAADQRASVISQQPLSRGVPPGWMARSQPSPGGPAPGIGRAESSQSDARTPVGLPQPSRGGLPLGAGVAPGTPATQLQAPALQVDVGDAGSLSPIAEPLLQRRVLAFVLTAAQDVYWAIAFFLVAMGYLVVVLGMLGWIP